MAKRIAVLKGGFSAEREVSLSSAVGVEKALHSLGYEVLPIDITRDMSALVNDLLEQKPDVAFNILHGRWGEDGCIQGLLEMMEIPYTHSGVLGSSLSMDKDATRRVCQNAGIVCPEGMVASLDTLKKGQFSIPFPLVIKPLGEGSSFGVTILMSKGDPLPDFSVWPYGDHALVERYIPGQEIHVAVMDDRALGAIEICPKEGFYDYETKYTDGKAEHIYPAPIPENAYKKAMQNAEKAHKVLGCRGVSRSDFRYDNAKGELYFLELNPQPGMTPLSLVPEIAGHVGFSYTDLVQWIVEDASCAR